MKTNLTKLLLAAMLAFALTGCTSDKPASFEHKVLALQDVEKAIFAKLLAEGAAEPDKEAENKLHIKDVEKAKSQNSMPAYLNTLGAEGWELTTVNENQLYIFQRDTDNSTRSTWEYKVLALTDVNDLIVKRLKTFNAVEEIKDKPGEYKITNTDKAKSQFIMPLVLDEMGKDGWELKGVNKASLYIFAKRIPHPGWLDQFTQSVR